MTTQTATAVRTLAIDRSHSEVAFQVRHLLSKVRGRFTDFAGTIEFDEANPQQSRVDVTIQAGSIDTAEPDRDKHLRTADFFEVEKYPTLSFKSTRVERKGKDAYVLHGDLTLKGVTKPVQLPFTVAGAVKDQRGNTRFGVEAQTTVNRRDFGINFGSALPEGGFNVGNEVNITLHLEALLPAPKPADE